MSLDATPSSSLVVCTAPMIAAIWDCMNARSRVSVPSSSLRTLVSDCWKLPSDRLWMACITVCSGAIKPRLMVCQVASMISTATHNTATMASDASC